MLASNVWTLLHVFIIVAVQGQPEPPWFQRISTTFDGVNLQKCSKKSKAPANNDPCSKKPKTCFFGNQDCPGVGPHPETKCVCSLKIWKCEAETCPVVKANDALANGCTADGVADLSSNDPLCPVKGPLDAGDPSAGCVPALFGKSCAYGSEKCCGQCHPNYISTCDSSGMWLSFYTDACFFPSCQRVPITGLEGKTCAEATSEILKQYPGIKVQCLKEADPLPTEDDLERYLVLTDASGKVLQVVFNKLVACPTESPVTTQLTLCETPGQACSYTYGSNGIPNAQCEASDSCTCKFGSWDCLSGISCVGAGTEGAIIGTVEAPILTVCPETSPLVSNNATCDAAGSCAFIYKSKIPGASCENTDTCTCSGGLWKCDSVIGCVPDEAPFIIGCPEASPALGNATLCDAAHQESPCTFQYGSTIPGGICQNTDTCSCNSTTSFWDCERSIGCVSANPPFIIGCPAESPVVSKVTACDAEHQEQPCAFNYGSTFPGAICQNSDICTCNSTTAVWDCQSSIGCVDDNPPFIIGCPLESPVVGNVTTCDAQHQEQPCAFKYGSTIPGGICENTDICSCNSTTSLWNCDSSIGCVSDNPPVATFRIACPLESPLVSNTTTCDAEHQDQPCSFAYPSAIPGGICQTADICSCNSTTGLWNCDTSIGCVSANPPFIIGCPAESPVVSNVTVCDTAHQEQPCAFKYGSTIPGGICENTDICSCNTTTGLWGCESLIGCVSDNPPFIIGCPSEPPANGTVCDADHQEQPCTFAYSSTIPGGICENSDLCTCDSTSGLWACDKAISCVSDNPPSIP